MEMKRHNKADDNGDEETQITQQKLKSMHSSFFKFSGLFKPETSG